MKNLTLLCLSILILTTIACNKEERELKKRKGSIVRNWVWNGERSYWSKANSGSTKYKYVDTLLPITSTNENEIIFMGKAFKFSRENKTEKTINYSRSSFPTEYITYYYDNDSVFYVYAESWMSNQTTITLSSKQ